MKGSGNDTIDRYPPACRGIEKILCVSGKIFKRILKNWHGFLKDNQAACKTKPSKRPKFKTKPILKALMPPNHYETINSPDSLSKSYRHRVSRLNDWDKNYGQGMYED